MYQVCFDDVMLTEDGEEVAEVNEEFESLADAIEYWNCYRSTPSCVWSMIWDMETGDVIVER